MMEAYLRESGIRDVRVVTLRDGPSYRWAIRNLARRCAPDLLFLSTERRRLATLASKLVRVVRFRRTGRVSSTQLRDSMAAGRQDWMRLTGTSVVQWILAHDGVGRVQRSYQRSPSR